MCTKELTAFENPEGGRPIFGWEGEKHGLKTIKLPCGKCPECCKDYYTSWATRGSRELLNWDSTIFVTLTYSDEKLPNNGSLKKTDVQDFIKRTKEFFRYHENKKIRQIYCGEYGSKTERPHYHAILFNADFMDKKPHRRTEQNHQVFTSSKLTELWGKGNVEFGYALPGSIAYLFKYILKKKSRQEKKSPRLLSNGQMVEHEFIEASRNPGIGAHLRGSVSLKKGYLTVEGVKQRLPKYYLEWLRKNDPQAYDNIQNLKFDFMNSKPKETSLRKKQKTEAQKKLTDRKKKL